MKHVYVLGGLRSHIGIQNKTFCHVPAELLGAEVLKQVMDRLALPVKDLDMVICGNAVGCGGNITRLMLLEAGLPQDIPAFTVDGQCGSGMESIMTAASLIESGEAELVIAGGFESCSTQPSRMLSPAHPEYQEGKTYMSAKFMPGVFRETAMLEGAEMAAASRNISREELDDWALKSHLRAVEARRRGDLESVTVSVNGSTRDDGIREKMSWRLLEHLPGVLRRDGLITAGNACTKNDGAAFVVLCSKRYLEAHGRKAKARILTSQLTGSDPMQSPQSAILSIRELLKKRGLAPEAVDCYEVNEPFAVIDALFYREFPSCMERLNIFGGALAYGHPYGASGAIIFLHLLRALEKKRGRYGVCSVAAAGGVGSSLLIERCDSSESDYLHMVKQWPEERDALIIDGETRISYKELADAAEEIRKAADIPQEKTLYPIQTASIKEQIISFLAFSGTNYVPVMVSDKSSHCPEECGDIPERACMAVLTSGTSGEEKILYRSQESWADFFPEQNCIFGTGEGTRLFLHGSPAFTGNLSFYISQLATGGSIITSRYFHPVRWAALMKEEKVDAIYLVPVKLRELMKHVHEPYDGLRSVIAGSQSLGAEDAQKLRQIYPAADIFLYYGASELSYVTYTTDREMGSDRSLIGKPFPGVEISLKDGEMFVKTPYRAEGFDSPCSIGDFGRTDAEGNYYFEGRRDERCKINGVNVSSVKVERALEMLDGIEEAAVIQENLHGKECLAAYVICSAPLDCEAVRSALASRLSVYEIPKKITEVKEFPRNENGKILKRCMGNMNRCSGADLGTCGDA